MVFEYGDMVIIKLLELQGFITAVCIRGAYITYEVTYFSNGEHYQRWFEYFEIGKVK
jgi:hypothetical protein